MGIDKDMPRLLMIFSDKAIDIMYDANDIDKNQKQRDIVIDIHCKLMDLAKLLKEQNK